jgi:serine/threonine-protein kinase RIM15
VASPPREITIDLPPVLVESLGVGAEMLANYLTSLAEVGANDPANHPPPLPILCRICERPISPFWFEKHSDLCLQEQKAEMDVQMAQEALTDHRNSIVKVLDALEARKGRPDHNSPTPLADYKGLPIGPSSTPSSQSGSASPAKTPPRSRDPSVSGLTHSRGRSFAVRRPLSRIVELVLDLCDTATEISMPAIKDSRGESGIDVRTQSPQSEARIPQVMQWQSPGHNTLEHEHGLAALCVDTEKLARAKVEAVLRHRRILEYSERIRIEFTVLLDECIAAAMRKAQQIAEGDLSDSTTEDEAEADAEVEAAEAEAESGTEREGSVGETPQPQEDPLSAFASAFAAMPAMSSALRNVSDSSLAGRGEKGSNSVAVSSRSSSPMECPTPRSHKSAVGLLTSQLQPFKRGSMLAESDTGGDSDSSMPSSALSGPWRTESPGSEQGLSRATSTRDRKRRSLILPGLSASPRRTQSPARNPPPSSPLRISKPRLPSNEHLASPMTSPLLTHHDFVSPAIAAHHRRQSSATSSEIMRPPVSPRLTSVSHPQPRALPPSIKDFEIIKPISKGAFGSVYLSKKKATGEYFAIKVLKKADMVAKNQVTNVKAERAIMMWQGESDFVAKLYWTFSSKEYLYLVMEYLNGGDCASLIKVLGGLPEDWSKKYLAEVVLGVQHLHGRGIVHRDLKPDNLLIDQKGHLKLTDFGLSRMGLIGRQKRALKTGNDSTPDLLKSGPFPRSMSIASSRSASFDFQGGTQSPNSTPLMMPDLAGSLGQPSYFNLNRESTLSREPSRRTSGYRSDSGGSDSLHSLFRAFSLSEPPDMMLPPPRSEPIDEETHSEGEGSDSPDFYALQPTASLMATVPLTTPLPMLPPPMALFDPEDHNRRFVGTPDYLAPETINGVGQDEMSDWWSLGCVMFEFLYGYPPFHADTPDEVFDNILARKIDWPIDEEIQISPEAKDLMNRLMSLDPHERLGANLEEKYTTGGEEIQNHPWFQDINWSTLLEDEAQFVPAPENPEDTEYFDARGATLQPFSEEVEDQMSPGGQPDTTPSAESIDRPHDALARVRNQVNSVTMKRGGLMPLHIPPHVRDPRSRRLSEPVIVDDFGNFAFKNLPVLEKANKDLLSKLRADTLQAQQRAPTSVISPSTNSPGPSLEVSPLLPGPLKRALSTNKVHNRPASPSNLSQANSSPHRPSQPSSPLIIQFATGQNHERRKTSSTSSTLSHQSSSSLQPGSFFDAPQLPLNLKTPSATSSPIKTARMPAPSPEKTHVGQQQSSVPTRTRSQTVGSQDGELPTQLKEPYVPGHNKRRSQIFGVSDVSPSSSDNEDPRAKALLRVQRRRQSSRRLSQITFGDGPTFRPLDVLICEDHPVSKLVMERHFEKLRCRTITAVNGSEAMRYAISEIQFDIITMEYKLPHINGADVARAIRTTKSANSNTPIICITGYLKELPEVHHFDHLIEKPPTLLKLTEVLCKFCQWKPPPANYNPAHALAIPPSSLRQETGPLDYSPSSTSSSFAPMSSYRGSAREDSISSAFTDPEIMTKTDEIPGLIISRQATEDWGNNGLGISEESVTDKQPFIVPAIPHLIHQNSAPPSVNVGLRTPRKQRSIEGIKAKRESLEKKRYECAESGDDEDEELGDVQVRARSPQGKQNRVGSKLGTEMMRTNSRGSVVSGSEELVRKEIEATGLMSSPPPSAGLEDMMDHKLSLVPEEATPMEEKDLPFLTPPEHYLQDHAGEGAGDGKGSITPPIIFPKLPGAEIKEVIDTGIDVDATPKPLHPITDRSEEPTPRAAGSPSWI